jgi:NAD(P)-dependent dehydrogenase (short-subunit alcohol dehydrogenase family)
VETGVAIVTGAGSGIGRALALELCRRGEELVLVDRDQPSAEDVAREVVEIGGVAIAGRRRLGCEVDPAAGRHVRR